MTHPIPSALEAYLDAIGIRRAPDTRKPEKAAPAKSYEVWRPSYPGEEPPF